MSTSGGIDYKQLTELLKNPREKLYNEIIVSWKNRIKEANVLINNIEEDNDYIENNAKVVSDEIDKLNKALDYYSELGINSSEIGYSKYNLQELRNSLESKYRTISIYYYNYMFNKFDESKNKIIEFEEKQKKAEEKMKSVESNMESLGATFLNIVLTISIVSSMVAVLNKARIEYAIPIVLACAWLLLSSIIFIGNFFKAKKENNGNTFVKIVYITVSIVTFISLFLPYRYNSVRKKIIGEISQNVYIVENNNNSKYVSINDKIIMDKFITDFETKWEENDIRYNDYKERLTSDNITAIIFYRYRKNNIEIYNYEILLVDGNNITFKTDNRDLKEWYKDNKIIKNS